MYVYYNFENQQILRLWYWCYIYKKTVNLWTVYTGPMKIIIAIVPFWYLIGKRWSLAYPLWWMEKVIQKTNKQPSGLTKRIIGFAQISWGKGNYSFCLLILTFVLHVLCSQPSEWQYYWSTKRTQFTWLHPNQSHWKHSSPKERRK